MRRSLTVVLALALVTAACGGGDGNDQTDGTGPAIEEIRPVTVSGAPLPPIPETGQDPVVANGMTMPDLVGASFDGTPVSITNDGRPKVILFLAHW